MNFEYQDIAMSSDAHNGSQVAERQRTGWLPLNQLPCRIARMV